MIIVSYTMNGLYFDSETPGPLYEIGQALKTEGNELYSFIDVSCAIYQQDVIIYIIFLIIFPVNNILLTISFMFTIVIMI